LEEGCCRILTLKLPSVVFSLIEVVQFPELGEAFFSTATLTSEQPIAIMK
jgi:hypothetical protein